MPPLRADDDSTRTRPNLQEIILATEWELECALCARFDLVLPDLHAQGYSIERQVLIAGVSRRMDVVLRRPGHAWIIELKQGSPNVADTTAQILDYERCWRAAFPETAVSLMVISNQASPDKIHAFAGNRIQYRAVSVPRILEILSQGVSTELLGRCTRLETDDEGRIRFLLSNFAHTTVPAGMRFGPPWSHESVFYALIRDGRPHKDPWRKNIYVKMFAHRPNCAVLYHPEWDNKDKDRSPLHINPRAKSWPAGGWLLRPLIESGAIQIGNVDRKGPGREAHGFEHYKINNWDTFASVLELRPQSPQS